MNEMGELFYKNGEIDFETLLDTLILIKKKNQDEKFVYAIDIFIERIRTENPYLHISNESSELFRQLDHDIENKDYDKAIVDLNLLYNKNIEIETSMKHRKKREILVSNVIGLIGIAISIVSIFIK